METENAIAYEVNVTTGDVVERIRTSEELSAELTEQTARAAEAAARKAAEEVATAKKAAVLEALAAAAGLDVEEVKEALNV